MDHNVENQKMQRVMIIDDDPDLNFLYQTLAEREGHEVIALKSGQEAIDYLSEHGPPSINLILIDFLMPGMNGRELIERLKTAYPEWVQKIPMVIMSAFDENAQAVEETKQLATAYEQKPNTIESFLLLLQKYLNSASA